MTEDEKIYTQVFTNLTRGWSEARDLKRLSGIGEDAVLPAVEAETRMSVESLLLGPEYDDLFQDREGLLEHYGGPEGVREFLATNQMVAFRTSVDHATIVFMHSALDAAISDLCRVTSLAAPEDWESFVADRKVTLGDVKGSAYADLLSAKVEEEVERLEGLSLLKRTDRLFAICDPSPGRGLVGDFRFDRGRLKMIDDFRHEVVHGSREEVPDIGDVLEVLNFMRDSGLHLFAMVNRSYGVKLNPLALFPPGVLNDVEDAIGQTSEEEQ
jgi:hypothetical protein